MRSKRAARLKLKLSQRLIADGSGVSLGRLPMRGELCFLEVSRFDQDFKLYAHWVML